MSKHDHNCNCGCDHDHEEEDLFVTLTTEDDKEIVCEVVAIFPAGDNQYIAVTPTEKDVVSQALNEPDELYFFRLEPDDEDEDQAVLVDIEDDDELEIATDAFDELVDSAEFDEE